MFIVAKGSKPRQSHEQAPLHVGVVCDSCNGEVRGIRFKCMMCRDYDLCESCERKGKHTEHHMIRITDPNQPWPVSVDLKLIQENVKI